jgi:hypothetical protein
MVSPRHILNHVLEKDNLTHYPLVQLFGASISSSTERESLAGTPHALVDRQRVI